MANRGVFRSTLLCIKKVDPVVFRHGYRGMREALTLTHILSHECPYLHPILVSRLDVLGSYWISELAPQGSLCEFMGTIIGHKNSPVTIANKLSVLLDISHGLDYLHSQGMIHGRLKPTNVILYPNYRAKLTDYGIANLMTPLAQYGSSGKDAWRFMSPEVVQQLEVSKLAGMSASAREKELKKIGIKLITFYDGDGAQVMGQTCPPIISHKEDCYAFGCIIMYLTTKQLPFANLPYEDSVWGALLRNETPNYPSVYDNKTDFTAVVQLSCDLIQLKPEHRKEICECLPVIEGQLCTLEFDRYIKLRDAVAVEHQEYKEQCDLLDDKVKLDKELIAKGNVLIAKKEVCMCLQMYTYHYVRMSIVCVIKRSVDRRRRSSR